MDRGISTNRLELRAPRVEDRDRFVALFQDPAYMVFSDSGSLDDVAAEHRFERMLRLAESSAISKRPIIERSTGLIVGYIGADEIDVDGVREAEFGYRLVADARGRGYATEAGQALLERASLERLIVVIHVDNTASIRTSEKLGFHWWKWGDVGGERRYIGIFTPPHDLTAHDLTAHGTVFRGASTNRSRANVG